MRLGLDPHRLGGGGQVSVQSVRLLTDLGGGGEDLTTAVAGELTRTGVVAATGMIPPDALARMRQQVDDAVERDATLLPPDRLDSEYGRVVFLPVYDASFLELLELAPLIAPCERVLGDDCTLYTMTTSCNPPHGAGRPLHIDTDIRIPGYPLVLGVSILLDDFDDETGSTRYLPEFRDTRPLAGDFEDRALRLQAPAGSVCWFDGRLWHDSTANRTDDMRRCIILALIRSFVRPRFDMAQMLAHHHPQEFSSRIGQKLGFDLLAPGSYREFYLDAAGRRASRLGHAARDAEGVPCLPASVAE